MKIGPFTVSSNNHSYQQVASVRVKRDGSILCVLYCDTQHDPLGHIQKNPRSPYRAAFVEQLLSNGVCPADVEMLLRPQPSKYFQNKMKREQDEQK